MSAAEAVHTVVSALAAIERHLGAPPDWLATTTTQAAFLRHVYAVCRPEVERIPEIESCGSTSAEELNAFAARRHLAVSFGPFGPNDAGAVSVLDLLITWTAPGQATRVVTRDRRRFPAVRLPASQVKFRRASFHPAPIAVIGTGSGETVYLTPLPAPGSDLVALAQRLTDDSATGGRFAGVVFPMVDLEVKHDLDGIMGLTTQAADGRPIQITAAAQHSSLKMNERGARAEAVVMMNLVVGVRPPPPPDFVIDEPFLVWVQRSGLSAPLFVAHVTCEAWRNPGGLAPRLSRPGSA
jgi:Serpin (serine protease inhibitor)